MIATIAEKKKSSAIAAIIAIIWKPLSGERSDNDRWDRTFSISAILVAAIAGKWFPYDRWIFFFSAISAITAIVAIISKPGLSYQSLLNKIRFNNYNI